MIDWNRENGLESVQVAESLIHMAYLVKVPEVDKKSAMDEMYTYLAEAIQIYEVCLGVEHP